MTSLALLILRVTVGGLLAGHGAQKLFGSFGGFGVEGTAGWLESLNLRPGRQWAILAGLSEFLGGVLTALGALNPLGPIMSIGAMLTAALKVHRGKPIWVTAGGAELPVVNIAAMTTLMLTGPGKLSFDGLLGIRVPRWFALLSFIGMVGGVAWAVTTSEARGVQPMEPEEGEEVEPLEPGAKLQGGAAERMEPSPAGGQETPEERELPASPSIAAMRPDEA